MHSFGALVFLLATVVSVLSVAVPVFDYASSFSASNFDTNNWNVYATSLESNFGAASIFTHASYPLQPSFEVDFQFRFINRGGYGNGADGLVFVINHAPSAGDIGGAGGNIGYYQSSFFQNSVAVEFDTYDNGANFGDPNNNHVSIATNDNYPSSTSLPITAEVGTPLLNDGQINYVWVQYDGTNLNVFLALGSTVKPSTPLLSLPLNLGLLLAQTPAEAANPLTIPVNFGFTAGTGGGVENANIIQWSYSLDLNCTNGLVLLPSPPLSLPASGPVRASIDQSCKTAGFLGIADLVPNQISTANSLLFGPNGQVAAFVGGWNGDTYNDIDLVYTKGEAITTYTPLYVPLHAQLKQNPQALCAC